MKWNKKQQEKTNTDNKREATYNSNDNNDNNFNYFRMVTYSALLVYKGSSVYKVI